MKQLVLSTNSHAQSTITIGSGTASTIRDIIGNSNGWSSIHAIYDKNVEELAQRVCKDLGTANLIPLSESEANKSFLGVESIIKGLHDAGADRHSLVINVGGGALGDCGGFAASIYMRGIPFVNVPTTLLAQVDASIGGKTGINACGVKNLVGTFSQPLHVIIDPQTLHSLPENHFASGCAEMLKHGLIADAEYWQTLRNQTLSSLRADTAALESAIVRSCEIKHSIVSSDEYENGKRKKLNFGHTVGHAIEAHSHTTSAPYLHGEAVALGMIVEATLSEISDQERLEISQTFQKFGLPIKLRSACDVETLITLMQGDKKNVSGQIKWTLLKSIGASHYDQLRDSKDSKAAIEGIMP